MKHSSVLFAPLIGLVIASISLASCLGPVSNAASSTVTITFNPNNYTPWWDIVEEQGNSFPLPDAPAKTPEGTDYNVKAGKRSPEGWTFLGWHPFETTGDIIRPDQNVFYTATKNETIAGMWTKD